MFRFRFFLAVALTTLLLVTGVEAAHAAESSSFRLFGEVSNDAIPTPLSSANFQLSEGGVGWRSNALTSTNFVMNPGTSEDDEDDEDAENEEEESNGDSGGGSEESVPSPSDTGGGGGGGGGRRSLPSQSASPEGA